MKTRLILITFFLVFFKLYAQQCDTIYIKKISFQAEKELSSDINKSYQLALEAFSFSQKCVNTNCFFKSLIVLSKVYYQKDQPDSIINLVLPILKKLPVNINKYYRANLNHRLSSAYVMKLDLAPGLKYSIDALKDFELIKDSTNIANLLVNISNIYQQQNNFNLSEKYLRQAETIASKLKNKTALGNTYNTFGILCAENNRLDSAEKFFLCSTSIRETLHDNTSIAWNYNNLGGLYVLLRRPKDAIIYLQKALLAFEKNDNYDGQTSVANNLGELYMQIGDAKKALEYYSYSRKLYQQTNNPDNLENLYNNLSVYYDKTNDLKTAFKYSDSLIVLKDSLYGIHLDKSMAEMQTKYEVEKKELENKELKSLNTIRDLEIAKQKQQNFIKSIIIISVLILLILIASLGYLFLRKKKIQQKAELDAEIASQKEIRIKSIIEAEEKERRRIAQDLHDGVGQILSAAKLNLSGLEAQINLTEPAKKIAFKNALDLIDDSVKEVRAVSHNMMPNTLIKLGLASAVKEFITKIGNVPNLKVDLEIVGLDKRIEENIETVLYRVIQEVIANIIKHAKATEIGIQLIKHDKEISIVIEDNGVGFDTTKINIFEGIGLKNIISRVEFINGTVHFDSTINKGTTVIIEVQV